MVDLKKGLFVLMDAFIDSLENEASLINLANCLAWDYKRKKNGCFNRLMHTRNGKPDF